MDNQLTISDLNPVYFVRKARAVAAVQYNTKFRDQFWESETRPPWLQISVGNYYQKWQTNDIIRLQVMSNVAPIKLKLFNCRGLQVGAELVFTQVRRNRYQPDLFIYEGSMALNGLLRGRYRLQMEIGDPIIETLESDWLDIADRWPNTVLWEYKNSFYWGDAIFATGWAPSFRVEGWFKMRPPSSKDEVFVDQPQNARLVFSDPFSTEEFIMGPASGVPDWTPDKMIWILGADELYGDGKAFTKPDGAKFAEEALDGYPYRGWTIDLQPTNRRASRIYPLDPTTGGKKILVALNVETEGFADTTIGSSSNVIQIATVE